MIIATLRLKVRAEKRGEFLRAVRSTLEPTGVEPGCLSCRFYQDIENENAFTLVEEWESQADLERHLRTDTFRMLLFLMDLLTEPPEIKFNAVSSTSPVSSHQGRTRAEHVGLRKIAL